MLRELDELVEAARLLGVTQAKKLFGCHTDEDRRFERAMYESIDKHRAALLDWEAKQPVTVEGFDEWYDSVDARFWDNRDACNAAFHAGKRAALAQQPVTVDEAAAQRLADAAKADLGWSHLSPQARVEKARRYLAIAVQQPAAVDGAMREEGRV